VQRKKEQLQQQRVQLEEEINEAEQLLSLLHAQPKENENAL